MQPEQNKNRNGIKTPYRINLHKHEAASAFSKIVNRYAVGIFPLRDFAKTFYRNGFERVLANRINDIPYVRYEQFMSFTE